MIYSLVRLTFVDSFISSPSRCLHPPRCNILSYSQTYERNYSSWWQRTLLLKSKNYPSWMRRRTVKIISFSLKILKVIGEVIVSWSSVKQFGNIMKSIKNTLRRCTPWPWDRVKILFLIILRKIHHQIKNLRHLLIRISVNLKVFTW
jgi:hypothetical protein